MNQLSNGLRYYDENDAPFITPEMASELLSNHRCIKKLDEDRVKKIEKALINGTFNFNGATIVLDADGRLIDGRVRLQACVNTGIKFRSLIVWGVDIKGQYTKDTGRSRNVIQILSKRGYNNPKALYYCASILHGIINSDGSSDGINDKYDSNITNQEVLDIIESTSDLETSVDLIMSDKHKYLTTSIYHLIVLDYLCRFVDDRSDIADEFLLVLSNTKNAEPDHPVAILRTIFMTSSYRSHTQVSKKKQIALMIKSYNLLKENKRCTRLHWIESTQMPEIYMITGDSK